MEHPISTTTFRLFPISHLLLLGEFLVPIGPFHRISCYSLFAFFRKGMVETGTPMIPVISTCPRPWDVILRLTFCFLGRMQGRARSVLLSIDRHGDFLLFFLFFSFMALKKRGVCCIILFLFKP